MTENNQTSHTEAQADPQVEARTEPTLRNTPEQPKGVLQKNLKMVVYLGAAVLVIVAALFSSSGKKTPAQQAAAKGQTSQPTLEDNTDLKNQLQAERQKEQQQASMAGGDSAVGSVTPAQQAAVATFGPTGIAVPGVSTASCVPGQPCSQNQQGNMLPQLTPAQQQAQMIAAKERERADDSRFASNLVYSRSAEPPQQQGQIVPAQYDHTDRHATTSPVEARAVGEQEEKPGGYKRPLEANIDSASGQPYLVYEGSVLDTVLMNRLDGDAAGPVKVLVSNPLYSHDRQHVVIPEGTVVLGEAKKIGATGFGQQRRMAVVFHRLIMPDGYSVDLDQFHGLDQIGEEGLKDKVNNHYLETFGASIALGVVAGRWSRQGGCRQSAPACIAPVPKGQLPPPAGGPRGYARRRQLKPSRKRISGLRRSHPNRPGALPASPSFRLPWYKVIRRSIWTLPVLADGRLRRPSPGAAFAAQRQPRSRPTTPATKSKFTPPPR
jgi:type IV secretion system protein TrbI